MPKFKVPATMTTELYIIVDADDGKQAQQIAKDADGDEFTEESEESGGWDVGEAVPYTEEGKEGPEQAA